MNVREHRRETRRDFREDLDTAEGCIPDRTISVAEHIAAAQARGVVILARAVLHLAEVLDQPFAAASPKSDNHSKKHSGGAA